MREHRGTLILVLGIVSLLMTCFPLGIAAWVMGKSDLEEMASGAMDPEGKGMTNAGKICGMISVAMAVLFVLVFGAMLALGVSFAALEGGGY